MNKVKIVLGFAIVLAVAYSCSKSVIEKQSNEESILLVKEELTELVDINAVMDEIDAIMDEFDSFGEFKSATLDCKTVTKEKPEDAKFPVTITIDYGEGCENEQGVIRRGKIIIVRDGPMKVEGSEQTSTYEGFSINNKAIEGSSELKCLASSESGLTLKYEADLTITKNDTIVINRKTEKTKTWLAGYGTAETDDDEWLFTGEENITRSHGRSISKETIEPIHRSAACGYALAGVIVFKSEGLPDATLNYGEGSCDEFATITVNDETVQIDLSGKWKKWNN